MPWDIGPRRSRVVLVLDFTVREEKRLGKQPLLFQESRATETSQGSVAMLYLDNETNPRRRFLSPGNKY